MAGRSSELNVTLVLEALACIGIDGVLAFTHHAARTAPSMGERSAASTRMGQVSSALIVTL
jgi:hypothetical protein